MKKIFTNMLPYWHMVLAVLALLIVQAYCDLSLPQYTSDMIDIGIQNHGISYIMPKKMTASEMAYSQLYMTEAEAEDWSSRYDKDGDLYVRRSMSGSELSDANDRFMIPVILTYQSRNTSEEEFRKTLSGSAKEGFDPNKMTLEEIEKAMDTDLSIHTEKNEDGDEKVYVDMRPMMLGMDKEQLTAIRQKLETTVDTIGSSTMKSRGIAYAIACDKEAGVDIDSLQKKYLWTQGFKMFVMAVIMLAAAVGAGYLASKVGAGVGRDLREKIFRRVISYSNTEMDKFSTASLITRSTNDVQQIQMVTAVLLRMLMYAPIIGIGGVIKVLNTGAHMGWIIIAAVCAILFLVALLIILAMPKFKAMQTLVDGLNLVSREILTGLPVIRAFGREKVEEERFEEANKRLMKTQLFTHRVMSFMMPGMTLIMYGTTLTIIWVSSHRIDSGDLKVGAMTAFITYAMMIVMSFLMLTVMSVILPRAGVAAERIDEVLKTDTSIVDPEKPQPITKPAGVVEFRDVCFRYPNADNYAIENISFKAEPGKTTAIIGSTGCGKSTLVNLIPRFYDVSEGSITIDGIDVRNAKMSDLRKEIGLVPQKGVLFSGTISSNLRFGDPGADDEALRLAADIAQATEFISSSEEGFERSISQGGTNVSGGQKQRLSIARAIVKKPKIYIFDDSFSALDMKTDSALRKALAEHVGSSTVIIVAQRISTIMQADQILVLDEGKLVGKGTHSELLRNCDTYRQIAASQLSEEELSRTGGEING
ncbi:ABC transporter ATP-binding protein [uncultured Ruminococcus sp.]|uniref:ABC transporter ATP-binding protein n=1 Tax=uncultured Ruminococcus sp. TaxID=165186 RepID=UPI00262D6C5E|nr:ABC transporter ATP-binding protein [uncultured Ruminococcus sp.]